MVESNDNDLYTKALLTFGVLAGLASISYFIRNVMNVNFYLYSVSFGPFFEEAFKGGVVFLFFLVAFNSRPNLREKLDKKRNWFIGGALLGFFIGLYEAFIEYSPGLYRIIPTFNHIFWSAIVATGIWLYKSSKQKWKLPKLTLPYVMVSISHISWNYHVYLTEAKSQEIIVGTMTWVTILASLIFIRKMNKFKF